MTAHIEAKKEEIAKTVLMPGDPKRAQFIAEKFLKDYKLVNAVRGMLAYTGFYNGKRVTVMASGMGMPSIGIYSYELYKFYDVDTIIRIGSAGAFSKDLHLYDIVLASDAYTDASFAKVQNGQEEKINKPSQILNDEIEVKAKQLHIPIQKGRLYSSDVFYPENTDFKDAIKEGCVATEMESFALFHNATLLSRNAACLVTISNHFLTGEETTSEEREKKFTNMILLALAIAR